MSLYRDVMHHAAVHPGRLAVEGPDGSLSYGQLDRMAAGFACALDRHGVRKGDRVSLYLRKSCKTVAMMQAVLRLGAVYVPIDPMSPQERVARIIRHSVPRLAVTESDRQLDVPSLNIDAIPVSPVLDQPVDVLADDPAYILYTSGSTGEPKGVCISHRNAEAFIDWVAATILPGPQDRFANHAPFHFDLSVLDLYTAFRAGASVHLIPETLSFAPARLNHLLRESRITIWYSVPSVLMLMLAEDNFPAASELALRVLFFAGETFPLRQLRHLFRQWSSHVRFFNLYGPTETNVCTAYEVREIAPDRTLPLPIGAACSGDRVWAEDADGREIGPGEEGQLMVAGPTVMLGYWGAEPLAGKPYATGDWVRRIDERHYEYLSRLDHMVKIRGYRVELGAIEAVLALHPLVERAAVIVEGEGLEALLVAYVEAREEMPSPIDLKRHCARHLPRYMIVDRVRVVSGLPLNGNGKIDFRGLHTRAANG